MILLAVSLISLLNVVSGQVLVPPYFNLAVDRTITASSTCGEGEGVTEPELYCKLTGSNPEYGNRSPPNLIQGQFCDHCDPRDHQKTHPASQANDGTEKWWQSPPLSRGMEYNEVNITVNLGQEFHVAYVFIKMGNSPRPGVFALERSKDNGQSYKPWMYFADTPSDCVNFFDTPMGSDIVADDTVLCTTDYSKVVPLENGEIIVSLLNGRPSSHNFSYASTLQDWTKATNVRLRLLRTKTLLGHLMAVARQDPTVTRRYYYSIKDISIGGRCVCNGHADVCDKTDPSDPYALQCRCQHNTCGPQCNMCCAGFVQKPWRPATVDDANACEPCQCYEHSNECIYDPDVAEKGLSIDIHGKYEGGGVCQNCRHNTKGINCQECQFGYFRPTNFPLNSTNVCQRCRCDPTFSTGDCDSATGKCYCLEKFAGENCERCNLGYYDYPACRRCDCNFNGTRNEICEVGGGQCPCKPNFSGRNCERCAYGYYGFPECKPCGCDRRGSISDVCQEESGQCSCKNNYGGRNCSECADGYYRFPYCRFCSCDPTGTVDEICNKYNGSCLCKENYVGERCDQCAPGYYNYPSCTECRCEQPGSEDGVCAQDGQCVCNQGFTGRTCNQCAVGYFNYPECTACNCESPGSIGVSCDQQTGQCECRETFETLTCNKCKENYYNYPICEECNCNPAGAKEVEGYPLGGCGASQSGRLCECKERVTGRICDECKPSYWNLHIDNRQGCEDCDCFSPGTVSGNRVCNPRTGECMCKAYTDGRRCNTCAAGTYNLRDFNLFGCEDCGCTTGGSQGPACDQETGQCTCKPRVSGRTCDTPIDDHFVPTLFQHVYEMEDGRTIEGGPVRFGFKESVFPGFSWRGYAIFSRLQDEVIVDVDVYKPSLYRVVFRYVNPNSDPVKAGITLTPQSSTDVIQSSSVVFKPTKEPQFVTVSGSTVVATFVLNPGKWALSLKTPENIFVDYLTVLPQAYYEASILQDLVKKPCLVENPEEPCVHYIYVDSPKFSVARGENGFFQVDDQINRTQLYENRDVLKKLGSPHMAVLNYRQPGMKIHVEVDRPGKYILLMNYHSKEKGRTQRLDVDVRTRGSQHEGNLILPGCPYSTLCRQVIVDGDGHPSVYEIDGQYATVTIRGNRDVDLAIDSIIAIPLENWDYEFVRPQFKCIYKGGKCIDTGHLQPIGSIKVEIESGPNADKVEGVNPPHIIDTDVNVIKYGGQEPIVNVTATVKLEGGYVFIIHYFQPDEVGMDVDVHVDISGQKEKGKVTLGYCPSVSGCRSVVKFENEVGGGLELKPSDISITLNTTSMRDTYLDYILIVPSHQFNPKIINVLGIDRSGDFITDCGEDDFHIDGASPEFCRGGVFKLTTEYNNGALACECNVDGSLSLSCDQFGGQCRCRANVIGRDCSACRTGYYGFPRCRQCRCPSGLCHPTTGQCVCPPRVTGANCDVCLPNTFGFDPLIGCEECNCSPYGVVDRNMDCDSATGQCNCKENVGGRRCDRCLPGYHSYPYCQKCDCDPTGSTRDICDQTTGECICKENVEGRRCDTCKENNFYLEAENPHGCTTCFCFGTTTRCDSSSLNLNEVRDLKGWGVTNVAQPRMSRRGGTWVLQMRDGERINEEEPVYWIAPLTFLENKVTAYGGKLSYTVAFELPAEGESYGTVQADVRLEGSNFTIVHTADEQPSPSTNVEIEVVLRETNFVHETTGGVVTREQFMMVLARIQALHIRANYYDRISSARISEIGMQVANGNGTGEEALNVERCQCPRNYVGPSCEQCAEGFYRSKLGPYLGYCVPCQCNNKADVCNPDTGECSDCRDNYDGPQCLTCRRGHYEDRRTGTCKICSCPLPTPANNFADSCEVGSRGETLRCDCYEGYGGSRCDICLPGHYGNPTAPDGSCNRCQCSNNIDMNDRRSCDPVSGACLECLNNSTGDNCERCQDWWYGDSIDRKDCQECECNRLGTARCDYRNGFCLCKPNVIGRLCDECGPNSFGFDSGEGCADCDCAEASDGTQCDVITGQCECRPGVTGRRCDRCMDGYWNYGINGCTKCSCEYEGAVTCDPQTGRCMCQPGVTGPQCDRCLPRFIAIPGRGCRECDSCVHLLLDEVEHLDINITEIKKDLRYLSVGVNAIKRLERANNTVHELRPKVDTLIPTGSNAEIDVIKTEVLNVEEEVTNVNLRAESIENRANSTADDASSLKNRVTALVDNLKATVIFVNGAVDFTKQVYENIKNSIAQKNADELLEEAEAILEELESRDFSEKDDGTKAELQLAVELLNRVRALKLHVDLLHNSTIELSVKIQQLDERIRDLYNSSQVTLRKASTTKDANVALARHLDDTKTKIEEIGNKQANIQMMLDMSRDLVDQAKRLLEDASNTFSEVRATLSALDGAIVRLRDNVDDLREENAELRVLKDKVLDHAAKLQSFAEELDRMFAGTRDAAKEALRAIEAYRGIVRAINESVDASMEAVRSAEEALNLTFGLNERARQAKENSIDLLNRADTTKAKVTDELRPRLENSIIAITNIETMNRRVNQTLAWIMEQLNRLPADGYSEQARQANQSATDANSKAKAAEDQVQMVMDDIPVIEQKIEDINFEVTGAQDDVRSTRVAVDSVEQLLPRAADLLSRLPALADKVDEAEKLVIANITSLRERIAIAIGEANRLRIGMNFNRETELQVRNPPNLRDAGSFTKLSLHFKTVHSDGLLAYIGPPQAEGTKTYDYLAVEVVDGFVTLVYNLGGGRTKVSNKERSVSDGKWHKVIVERVGKKGIVTVQTENEEDAVASSTASGTYAVLNLDMSMTQFHVGGVPLDFGMPSDVKSRNFDGCMHELDFDDVPMGFWDFVKGKDNNIGCGGRPITSTPDDDVYRFDGNGFVIKDAKKLMQNPLRDRIKFDFRTYGSDGLFVAAGLDMDYMAVWLRDGHVVMSFDLGSGHAEKMSQKQYNDGKWHTVFAIRHEKSGFLKIDEDPPAITRSAGRLTDLDSSDFVYIAGLPSEADIVARIPRARFRGCLRQMEFTGTLTSLLVNKGSMGILPGCSQVARVVSFDRDAENSYISAASIATEHRNLDMTLKFRTLDMGGLIFYVANEEQSQYMSLSMTDGEITYTCTGGQEKVTLATSNAYNDGHWHYITVVKNGHRHTLSLDDEEVLTKDEPNGRKKFNSATPFYFGGIPSTYIIPSGNVASDARFYGCLADVTINAMLINFSEDEPKIVKQGANLKICPVEPKPTEAPTEAPTVTTESPFLFARR